MSLSRKLIGLIGFVALTQSIAYPEVANAFPFKPNPQSFASYLSAIPWDDGLKRVFSNFYNCQIERRVWKNQNYGGYDTPVDVIDDIALCNGYVNVYYPHGIRSCHFEGRSIVYERQIKPKMGKILRQGTPQC